ncbi:hypothetical protein [Mycolicibacterium phlei]
MKPEKVKRTASARKSDDKRRTTRGAARGTARGTARRSGDAQTRRTSPREQRPLRSAPQTSPIPRPTGSPGRPKSASQAKARAKARKAKAPKVVRPPLKERILVKLASIDLSPRRLVARVPFVVLVIGSLGLGLGVTLWLSTDAAERSYQLGHARETNQALMQQKEALERDVLEAQAAPALAEAARELGMIPSRDTARLVQDPAGNWVVVGTPKPAEGVPPPPLNTPLPEETPAPPSSAPAPQQGPRVVEPREVPVRLPERTTNPAPGLNPGLPGLQSPAGTVAPLAVPPGLEVPQAVQPQPLPQPQLQPQVLAPLDGAIAQDGAIPHSPTPQGLPGPVPGVEQSAPVVVPPAGAAA